MLKIGKEIEKFVNYDGETGLARRLEFISQLPSEKKPEGKILLNFYRDMLPEEKKSGKVLATCATEEKDGRVISTIALKPITAIALRDMLNTFLSQAEIKDDESTSDLSS